MLDQVRFLKKVMPAQRNAAISMKPHALAVDPHLSGTTRFCYSLGNYPSILTSDNYFTLTEGIHAGDTELVTTDDINDDYTNCILSIAASEHVLVTSQSSVTDADGIVTTTFEISNTILTTREEGQRITILAFGVITTNDASYSLGTLYVSLKTNRIIVAGDNLGLLLNDGDQPTLSPFIAISNVSVIDHDLDTGLTSYLVTLATPLPYDLSTDITPFIEAKPAFESNRLLVPPEYRMALAAVDVHGGETLGKGILTATYRVTTYDGSGVLQASNIVNNNDVVKLNEISTAELACALVDRGTLGFSNNLAYATLDSSGQCAFGIRLDVATSFSSKFYIKSTAEFQIAVDTELDQNPTFTTIQANTSTLVTIQATDVFIIRIVGSAKQVVQFSEDPSQATAHSVEYTVTIELHENEQFECSGLLLKPMLPSIQHIMTSPVDTDINGESYLLETNRGTVLC